MPAAVRSALSITCSTWKALFLREAVKRISAQRAAWLWVLLEPVSHMGFILILYSTVRVRTVGGIDTIIWIIAGMLPFFTFRRTTVQCLNAVSANRALFAYRQVKPIDTVLVRACVEGFLMLLVSMILLAAIALLHKNILPENPLQVLQGAFGLWLLGLGCGLVISVAVELVPEIERVVTVVMYPLYLLSGVMFPIASVPLPFRDWLLLNPVVHGVESVRTGFAPYYHSVAGLQIGYLHGVALVAIFLGLMLHLRFKDRMVME
jgi:capsular polysaccharide transport system permease protein